MFLPTAVSLRVRLATFSRRSMSAVRSNVRLNFSKAHASLGLLFAGCSCAVLGWLNPDQRVLLQQSDLQGNSSSSNTQSNPDRPDVFSANKTQRESILREMKDKRLPLNFIDFITWSNEVCKELSEELNLYDRIYKGKSQLELYEHLFREALHLSIDKYRQRGDQSSWTLMGAKGIGKSAALRNFTDLGNVVFPNVIPVYISFNNVCLKDFALRDQTICEAIFEELRENWGIEEPAAKRKETQSSRLERTLLENNLHVLLLVDELDQLYRKDDPALHSYLAELISFANNPLGRIGTTICGSSAAMVDLITCSGGPQMFEFFPNLHGAPHMNGSKFQTIHISSNLPVSLEVISEITNIPQSEETIKTLRLIMFAAGASARRVGRQLDRITATPQDSLSSRNTLSNTQASLLWGKMYDLMIEKNKGIFDKLVVDGKLRFDAIVDEPWEDEFKPLRYEDVAGIWRTLVAERSIPEEDSGALIMRQFDLSDRTWIVLDGVKDGLPAKIYPSSLWHLARRRVQDKEVPTILERLNVSIQQALV